MSYVTCGESSARSLKTVDAGEAGTQIGDMSEPSTEGPSEAIPVLTWSQRPLRERAWYAYQCLPLVNGRLPRHSHLEAEYSLPGSLLVKVMKDGATPTTHTMLGLAFALRCDVQWLTYGFGEAPKVPEGRELLTIEERYPREVGR